ncbi:MAG: PAS domain S-box protein [Thermodesulfobacteria bacterium]|nr:PAS domain S-box protein [Thermodesulfobacteriota bacterium]
MSPERRFLDLLEDIPVGLFVSRPDGTILAANKTLASILRCPNREILLRCKATDFYEDPRDREKFLNILRSRGVVQGFEARLRCFNGQVIYAALSARYYRQEDEEVLSGIIQDLTTLAKARKELAQSEEKFRLITETAPEAIFGFDLKKKIIFWNPSAEKLFGFRTEEVMEKEWPSLLLEDPQADESFVCGRPVELRLKRKTGETFVGEIFFSPTAEIEEEKVTFAFVRDITWRKELEREWAQKEKIEALKLMARGFLHDFNNLFFLLKGQLEMASLHPEKAPLIIERLKEISGRLENLLEGLALFAGLKAAAKQPVEIVPLLQEITRLVLYGSQIECIMDSPAEELIVWGDKSQLAQLFQNLVINARQALQDAGKMEIRIRKVGREEASSLGLESRDFVEIMIKDYGPGIPKERLARIFEPYFSTKEEGTGLGLAIASEVVKSHHGYIKVTSEEGSYTAFWIYLPLWSPS